MADEGRPFLEKLTAMLGERGRGTLYPCIRDLVEHGLSLERFPTGEWPPDRQAVTQYLAAWSRHAGLSEEESRAWLVDYTAVVLAPLSQRTPAAIRHSTKSNLRYIYRSEVPFLCQCAQNPFRADCRPDCPFHAGMQAKLRAGIDLTAHRRRPRPTPPPVIEPVLPVKEVYREQFQKAVRLAAEEAEKGTDRERIVAILRERGLKTRTGREWTYSTLARELAAWNKAHRRPKFIVQAAARPDRPTAGQGVGPSDDSTVPKDHPDPSKAPPSGS